MQVLAQGLRLIALDLSKLSAALSIRPEYLEQWLDLVEQVGSTQVAAAFEHEDSSWSAGLFYHARNSGLRRRLWDLLPAAALGLVSLNQLEPLLSELAPERLPQYQAKLRAVLAAVLTTNLSEYTPSELAQVQKLLALNLQLSPELYSELIAPCTEAERLGLIITNLMVLGRRVSAVSDAVVTELKSLPAKLLPVLHAAQDLPSLGGAPNVLGSLLEGLVGFSLTQSPPPDLTLLKLLSPKYTARCLLRHHAEFGALIAELSALPPAELDQLTELMACLVAESPNDPQVLAWVAAWQADVRTKEALSQALAKQLSPEGQAPQLLALDVSAPDSLKLLELLPRALRLQHAGLLVGTSLWADFVAAELKEVLALLGADLSADYLNGALALLGLAALEHSALALCCALSDATLRSERPALSTALLTDAPSTLLSAVTKLSEPEYAPLRELLPAQLYRRVAPEQPWVNETNLT